MNNDRFQNYQHRCTPKSLNRVFISLSNSHYGSSKEIKRPFYGGFLELHLAFNNGLINVTEVSAKVLDIDVTPRVKKGYTDDVRLAISVYHELVRLSEEGQSAEAQLMSNIFGSISVQSSHV
jgi:hypothetical protein